MSKAKLLGIRETQGKFEGKPYHSVKLHIAEPFTAENSYGQETSIQSVKFERMPYIFGRPITVEELATYVNSTIDIMYDKYGNPATITFEAD